MLRANKLIGLFFLVAIVSSCTTINSSHQLVTGHAKWGIVPFSNNTEVPQAGYRAMSITQGLLAVKGAKKILVYKAGESCNQLIACPNSNPTLAQVLAWADQHQLRYVMTGTVNEWVYKVGLDGEPVASVTLQLYEVPQRKLIWNAVGSKFGTTRSGLGVTGQTLIKDMLTSLQIVPG